MCIRDSYITDRNFPDKAIDALDEAGSRVHLTNINVPKEIEEQEKLIEEARSLKAEAVKSQNFELAASYRDREKELSVRLEEIDVYKRQVFLFPEISILVDTFLNISEPAFVYKSFFSEIHFR